MFYPYSREQCRSSVADPERRVALRRCGASSQPSTRNARLVRFESADVARYYDQNTASFLAHGQAGAQGIIHRAVWGEGVSSPDEAFHLVHDLLRARIAESGARRILDLGCGVGASLEHVLRGTEVAGFGVTNSGVHAELARNRLGGRATIFELDFCSDPLPGPVDLAFGIESFVQATDAEAFVANIANAVAENGYLVLCDDFLAGAGESQWVSEFRRGWRSCRACTRMGRPWCRCRPCRCRRADRPRWPVPGRWAS